MGRALHVVPAVLVSLVAGAGGAVHAEPLFTDVGVAVTVGGGVEQVGFSDRSTPVGPAALWETRLVVGTRLPVSTELAYLGTLATIERSGQPEATLMGTGVEVLVRANLAASASAWRPYIFTGRAVRHYAVTGERAKAARAVGGHDRDVVLDLPIGGGIAVYGRGLVVDARVAYRAAVDSELVEVARTGPGEPDYADMHSWVATLVVGVEL